jgi:hypothetical protein
LLAALTCGVAAAALATTTACSTLLGSEPTPVPGAAATLTRAERTPIPTPVHTPSPVVSPAAVASRSPLATASAAPRTPEAEDGGVSDQQVAQVQRQLERSFASPDLPGIEGLLLDRVSLSSPEGGEVLARDEAARWMRDHAAPGIQLTQVDRAGVAVLLEVRTEGWPSRPPIAQGRVTLNLHRYDASGAPDELRGDWKIDVIGAE